MSKRLLTIITLTIFLLTSIGFSLAQDDLWEEFDHSNFDNPTTIDNKYFPLTPGMRYTYEGTSNDEGEEIERRVVRTVTDLTKEIDGIQTLVIWDLDFDDDELIEAEIAFFAQDNDGTIWRMGEHPEEYEDDEFIAAPTWIAGQGDGKAGILLQGDPQPNTLDFSQGFSEEAEFTDRSMVFSVGEEICVAVGCFENVLIMDEFNPEELDAYQQKYYAPDVGLIQVGWRGEGEEEQEELELTEIEELDEAAMTETRDAAFVLENHAYEVSAEVYGETAPMEQMGN